MSAAERHAGTLSRDTDPAAEEVQIGIYRRMPPWRKIELLDRANQAADRLVLAGLRARHPEAAEGELRRRLHDLRLGPELAARVFGPLPADPGTGGNGADRNAV